MWRCHGHYRERRDHADVNCPIQAKNYKKAQLCPSENNNRKMDLNGASNN